MVAGRARQKAWRDPSARERNVYNAIVLEEVQVQLDSSLPVANSPWHWPRSRPEFLLRCEAGAHLTTLTSRDGVLQTWRNPLEALCWMEQHIRQQPASFPVRWVGYLSYDLGRLFEEIPSIASDDLSLPLFAFAFTRQDQNPTSPPDEKRESGGISASNFTRDGYCRAVARVIQYIRSGDVFQVNLSQRFTCKTVAAPEAIYRRLSQQTPARYGAFLNFGDHALISNSPELFLHIRADRRVITRPIKGTRPLLPGMDSELLNSSKDQAELNMIVDLERNDLGRVCEIGSVRVTEPRVIEAHPTVYHGAATIEGILRRDVGLIELLRATFPGGSITGAPKIRAMQIIDELEPVRRGPYCGAIGYLAADGAMQFNIAIRTMIAQAGQIHIPVGGGIVADSEPEAEYEETLVKARAMFAALECRLDSCNNASVTRR
jgi:aminodeoxychorismate synthase component I